MLELRRHQPPNWISTGHQQPRTVKLIQEQVVLTAAAIFRGEGLRVALPKSLDRDRIDVDIES